MCVRNTYVEKPLVHTPFQWHYNSVIVQNHDDDDDNSRNQSSAALVMRHPEPSSEPGWRMLLIFGGSSCSWFGRGRKLFAGVFACLSLADSICFGLNDTDAELETLLLWMLSTDGLNEAFGLPCPCSDQLM